MKKHTFLIAFLTLISLFTLTSCSNNSNSSENTNDQAANIYKNKVEKFDISTKLDDWSFTSWQYFTLNQDSDDVLKVKYNKSLDNSYGFVYTTLDGDFADFKYINIKVKGTVGETLTIRLLNDLSDSENNLLGSEVSLPLQEEYSSYTLKVKTTYQTRLDIAKYFAIIPDIGRQDDTTDYFYIQDISFSKELLDGYEWINTGVDTGEGDSISVNGWTTYTWTGYSLLPEGNEVKLSFQTAPGSQQEGCADYAYLEKNLDINDGDNYLEFKFTNDKWGKENSTTRITFILRGDVEDYITPSEDNDVEYAYYKYYEQYIYNYRFGDEDEVVADSNGIITLNIPIGSAIKNLEGKHENGLRLTLLVESNPQELGDDYMGYDGFGVMTIKSLKTYRDDNLKETTWLTPSWCNYNISYNQKTDSTTISSSTSVSEYSYVETPIIYEENLTTLTFKFINKNNSYTNIKFMLRGDVSEHIDASDEVEYEYDLFYEQEIYNYDLYNENEIKADENEIITLTISIEEASNYLKDHITNGLRLTLFIESDPNNNTEEHPFDGIGSMTITSFEVK